MKVIKCDRCGDIYLLKLLENRNNTIHLCEKCINELELCLSNKNTKKLSNKTDGEIGSTN